MIKKKMWTESNIQVSDFVKDLLEMQPKAFRENIKNLKEENKLLEIDVIHTTIIEVKDDLIRRIRDMASVCGW